MTPRARRALMITASLLAMAPCVAQAEQNAAQAQAAATPAPALGEDEALYRCKPRNAEVAVSFKPDMELKELMTWVVGFTCKNFILDPRVVVTGKKITVIAPNKMTAHEAYRLFLVALSTMNLTVVPKGNVLRISDAGAARRDTVPIMRRGVPDDDQVVRYILRPTYSTPDTLVPALTALKSEIGEVTPVGSMVMLVDYGGNVRDMLSLVKLVDVPKGSEGIYTIAIEHANAANVAKQVGGILGVAADGAAPPAKGTAPGSAVAFTGASLAPTKVMVDDRTNTIILAANEVAYERFRALAKRIDVPLDIEGGQAVHVYRLKNAIAEELAKTLNDTVGQNQVAAAVPGAGTPKPAVPLDGATTQIDGKVRVIADKPTNALIVLATGRDFLALREVIGSLDLPRPQVYIEAMFVEVGVGNTLSTDGSLHGASSAIDKAVLVGGVHTTDGFTSTVPKSAAAAKGVVAGIIGSSVSVLGLTIPSYAVLFNALQDKSKANVLSTPSMMALDNETAKFKMGRSIPYQRGLSISSVSSTDVPAGLTTANLDRIDLNLELEVKPHISGDESVLLELKHDAKDLESQTELGPTWTTRSFETRVLVRDQQTIVIGGMMQERTHKTTSQVPILGDIPLIGYFFKSTHTIKQKSNLLILLTPYIVHSQMELEMIKERKLREHEEFVGSLQTFEAMKYIPRLDYAKKRGLVEEINRAVEGVEIDARNFERMAKPIVVPTGPIELPVAE